MRKAEEIAYEALQRSRERVGEEVEGEEALAVCAGCGFFRWNCRKLKRCKKIRGKCQKGTRSGVMQV